MARQQFLQHLDFVRQWRLADQALMRGQIGMGRFFNFQDNSDAPSWRQVEKERQRAEKFAGMTPTERERYAANDIHQWAGNHKVYFVGTQRDLWQRGGGFFDPDFFKIIARIPLPEPPPQPRNEGLMGAGRPRTQNETSGGQNTQPPPLGGWLPSTQKRGSPRFGRPGSGMFGRDFLQGEKELVIAEWRYPG